MGTVQQYLIPVTYCCVIKQSTAYFLAALP